VLLRLTYLGLTNGELLVLGVKVASRTRALA
jgi:hypothetical protein